MGSRALDPAHALLDIAELDDGQFEVTCVCTWSESGLVDEGSAVDAHAAHAEDPQSSWPAHLRDDAPFQRCGRCRRCTWAIDEFDLECRMTQPDGHPCGGRFAPTAAGDTDG